MDNFYRDIKKTEEDLRASQRKLAELRVRSNELVQEKNQVTAEMNALEHRLGELKKEEAKNIIEIRNLEDETRRDRLAVGKLNEEAEKVKKTPPPMHHTF